jgi:hypothetical protein
MPCTATPVTSTVKVAAAANSSTRSKYRPDPSGGAAPQIESPRNRASRPPRGLAIVMASCSFVNPQLQALRTTLFGLEAGLDHFGCGFARGRLFGRRRPESRLRRSRLERKQIRPSILPPPRLPCSAGTAPSRPRQPLGLRRQGTGRLCRRSVRRRSGHRRRVPAPLRGSLPDPASADDRRLQGPRRGLACRGQHIRLQLPLRDRARPQAVVITCLRAGRRRESGREPVPRPRSCSSAGRAALPRSLARAPGDGGTGRSARSCVRRRWVVVGRSLGVPGLPAFLRDGRLTTIVRFG